MFRHNFWCSSVQIVYHILLNRYFRDMKNWRNILSRTTRTVIWTSQERSLPNGRANVRISQQTIHRYRDLVSFSPLKEISFKKSWLLQIPEAFLEVFIRIKGILPGIVFFFLQNAVCKTAFFLRWHSRNRAAARDTIWNMTHYFQLCTFFLASVTRRWCFAVVWLISMFYK